MPAEYREVGISLHYSAGVTGCNMGLEVSYLSGGSGDGPSGAGAEVEAWKWWQLAEIAEGLSL